MGKTRCELGVVSIHWPIDEFAYLSFQGGSCILDNSGRSIHGGIETQSDLRPFSDGSIVSFTLDLRGQGVLTASIDGNAPIEVFSGGILEGRGENHGFVPAISCHPKVSVEFLGFEKAP
jgi:hypothetical protein